MTHTPLAGASAALAYLSCIAANQVYERDSDYGRAQGRLFLNDPQKQYG